MLYIISVKLSSRFPLSHKQPCSSFVTTCLNTVAIRSKDFFFSTTAVWLTALHTLVLVSLPALATVSETSIKMTNANITRHTRYVWPVQNNSYAKPTSYHHHTRAIRASTYVIPLTTSAVCASTVCPVPATRATVTGFRPAVELITNSVHLGCKHRTVFISAVNTEQC